jgi:hypothetical protein
MTRPPVPLDVSAMPELARLAEEVRRSRQARVLRRDGEDIAVLAPPTSSRRQHKVRRFTEADRAAFESSAGSWRDVDTDALVQSIYESRHTSRRPVRL